MEHEPDLVLRVNGKEFEVSRHNTTVYSFAGSLAMFNHVHIKIDEDGMGAYAFQTIDHHRKVYEAILPVAMQNAYPAILNMDEVADCDRQAYEKAAMRGIKKFDHIPDDWQ